VLPKKHASESEIKKKEKEKKDRGLQRITKRSF
jgi:hypothetical protein